MALTNINKDNSKEYLCKYHHATGATSEQPGNGFSSARCKGCGLYFIELSESNNYATRSDPSSHDDENDMDYLQNAYDPSEKIYEDGGSFGYW